MEQMPRLPLWLGLNWLLQVVGTFEAQLMFAQLLENELIITTEHISCNMI